MMTTTVLETQTVEQLAPVQQLHYQIEFSRDDLKKLARKQSQFAGERLSLLKTDHESPPTLRRLAELETQILSLEHQKSRLQDKIQGLTNDLPGVREKAERASEELAQSERRMQEIREAIATLDDVLEKDAEKLVETAKDRSQLIHKLRETQDELWKHQEVLHCAPQMRVREVPELGKSTQELMKLLEE